MADLVILRGVDWSAFGSLTGAGAAVGTVGVVLNTQTLMLLVVSSALLAAGAAFVLDEAASAIVDVTSSRSRQTRVRGGLLAVPFAAGCLLVAVSPKQDDVTRVSLLVAFSGALLLGYTIAWSLRERSGVPGLVAATTCLAVTLLPALLGRLCPVQTFPGMGPVGPVLGSNSWWTMSDAACVGLLVCSTRRFRVR
jgi:hypothetical protein